MRSFYLRKWILGLFFSWALVFLSSCADGEVTGIASPDEDWDDLQVGIGIPLACISKGTPGAPDIVDGRILSAEQAGDTSDWVEIAQYEQFSLVVRANYINIHSSAAYYGNPAWQYTAYGKLKSYSSSNVRNAINAWFNGRASGAADNLPSNARLRYYTMQNNALKTLGTSNTDKSLANGLSLPGSSQVGEGDDLAFALSWSESANFLSRSQFRTGSKKPDVPSQVDAIANYDKLSIPSGRDYGMWLRSPGDAASTAGALANADGPTGGRVYQMKLSEHGHVYPAAWVDSSIFDPLEACEPSSEGAMPTPAGAMAVVAAAANIPTEKIVVSGGAYGPNAQGVRQDYQYEFIDTALRQLKSCQGATWLVADIGWTADQRKFIEEAATSRNIPMLWFKSARELTQYINKNYIGDRGPEDPSKASAERKGNLIRTFHVYSHGYVDSVELGHGNAGQDAFSWTKESLDNIDPAAFEGGSQLLSLSFSKFYACNTGTGESDSFAQKWANITNASVQAYAGKTNYSDINSALGILDMPRWLIWRNNRGNSENRYEKPGESYRPPEAGQNALLITFKPSP
ncbi:MAG: hypothetical protein FWG75_00015 [Cystobacterineae bacterium]|nr:hypothetical protein [Cystobacterineae bacterium]